MCVTPEWRILECASPLLFCHQTLQMLPPLSQLLTQHLMPSHLRPQLIQKKGVFTPVLFGTIESNSSLFPPLVRIYWAGVNTEIALGCGPNNHTETELKNEQTLVRLNGWTNEWMTLAHVWFYLQFLVHLQKEQCESEPHQKKRRKEKSILYLVRTKASELADFPGVNTPESQPQSITHTHVDIFNETWEISVPPLRSKCKYSKWKFKRACLTCENHWGLMMHGLLLQFLYDLLEA